MRTVVTATADAVHITVSGELDLSTEHQLVDQVEHAFTVATVPSAVLDLTPVEFIDSSGLRALLRCKTSAENRGLRLQLRAGEGPVARLLDLAGATPSFEMV